MSDTTILAWYFSDESRTLRHGDGRKIELGCSHEVEGNPVLCEHGLHASVKLLDALRYAPGPVVYRVELSGEIAIGDDKIVAQKRTYLAGGIDVSDVLMAFARKQALSVAHLWDMPDVVKEYLETGNESLNTEAQDAARAATWNAARVTTGNAVGAAWATANAANAANTVWDLRATAWADAEKMLTDMINEAIEAAKKQGYIGFEKKEEL
jgi:hypothetical protein